MSFKIIALEVLDSCDTKHSKNLIKNTPYIFYKNYKIEGESVNQTIEVVSEDFDLYSKNSKPKINISAIVGKNGSGKSTIIELLIKAINNLFFKYKKQNPNRNFHKIEEVVGINVIIYYKIGDNIFKVHVENSEYQIFKYKCIEIKKYYSEPKLVSKIDLKDFFYTEVINYSLYAYNSLQEGNWIKHIFHKNDAYQTPVVLNPFRKIGNIDINTENALVFQRLLANILRYDSEKNLNLKLGEGLEVKFILLELKKRKSFVYYFDKSNNKDVRMSLSGFDISMRNSILTDTLDIFYSKSIEDIKIPLKILSIAKSYILYKLISICSKYEEYGKGLYFDFDSKNFIDLKGLLFRLKDDYSHITFKLRQTLNYLIHKHIPYILTRRNNKIEVTDLADTISKFRVNNIIEILPPSIFEIDIELRSIKSLEKKNIKFSTLSSGEKQQIYSANSIYYHLINLDSVKYSTDKEKISYRNINVILEEIELYFHPEYQRTYIDILLNGIKKLNLKNIDGINFIFVTHSPFILSDIPSSNIMYLTTNNGGFSEDSNDEKKSFGANIHHLLSDNFFFGKENVFIGKFVHRKVSEIIDFIKTNKDYNKVQYYCDLIDLIDEPILKNKLTEMLFENFPDFAKQRNIEEKEQKVRNFAKQLGVDINITRST